MYARSYAFQSVRPFFFSLLSFLHFPEVAARVRYAVKPNMATAYSRVCVWESSPKTFRCKIDSLQKF